MAKFCDIYNSLTELYNSILRGNEIEFQYDNKCYYILPSFDKNNIVGVCFGEAYTENEIVCLSEKELYNAQITNTVFGKIISKINIVWKNF